MKKTMSFRAGSRNLAKAFVVTVCAVMVVCGVVGGIFGAGLWGVRKSHAAAAV